MATSSEDIRAEVRDYILRDILQSEDSSDLTDTTPLITGGILDSISTIRLVSHLEKRYGVVFGQGEVTVGKLDTIDRIVESTERKLKG